MTTPPMAVPAPEPTPIFKVTPSGWDFVKFLWPYILALASALIGLGIQNVVNTQAIAQTNVAVARFQDAKESRGERLSVLEQEVKQRGEAIGELKGELREVKGDIKTLLQRIPDRGR